MTKNALTVEAEIQMATIAIPVMMTFEKGCERNGIK